MTLRLRFLDRLPAASRRIAPLLLVVVVGCGTVGGLGGTTAFDSPRNVFASGYEKIEAVYIEPVDMGDMAMAGLNQLASLDPRIAIAREGDRIEIAVVGGSAQNVATPTENDPDAWGSVTADVVEAARAASAGLGGKTNEDVYEAVFTGALTRLDGFSRYSSAAQATENRATREGFGGIGVRVAVEDDAVRVISVMHYTPAERVGLRSDDVITHIDGKSVVGMDQEKVIDLLRGPDDSRVGVTVVRDRGKPFNVVITRAHIVPETVTYERQSNVAYIHVYGFNLDTAESLRKEIENAQQDIGPGIKGYILDLRGNPGGLLDQSVSVSDLFMSDGRIVSTHGRHPDSHQYFEATPGDIAEGRPIVVLINGDSASAAEIVAAALQDSGRAVVVGSNSYGKGTVQTVLRMPNNGEMTLTWARFHAPSGYTLNHLGVLPSICTDKKDSASQVIESLRRGRLTPIPTSVRNSVDPNDTPALSKLRSACPVRRGEEAVDVQVAQRLLEDPSLYRRAIHLADLPRSQAAPGSAALSQVQP